MPESSTIPAHIRQAQPPLIQPEKMLDGLRDGVYEESGQAKDSSGDVRARVGSDGDLNPVTSDEVSLAADLGQVITSEQVTRTYEAKASKVSSDVDVGQVFGDFQDEPDLTIDARPLTNADGDTQAAAGDERKLFSRDVAYRRGEEPKRNTL